MLALSRGWWELGDPLSDYALSYDWEEDRDLNALRGRVEPGVTWRMTSEPFRIVPTWVRDGAEAAYEQEGLLWALAGETSICSVWGVPVSLCRAFDDLVNSLISVQLDGFATPSFFVTQSYLCRCDHVGC